MNLLPLEPDERFLSAHDWRARHIRRVLRLTPGDTLRAGVTGGATGTARIIHDAPEGITVAFSAERDPAPLAPVELLLGHPRPIVLRRMLRDLAALGPARLLVVPTALGEKSYYHANLWDDARTPLVEGAAQGGSTLLPELVRCRSLADGIESVESASGARIVLHGESDERGGHAVPTLLARLAASARGPNARVCVAVGSERGWTADELRALGEAGFAPATLGPRILRTETAALIAVWAAISSCEAAP